MKKILGLMVGILLIGANLYAGNGDLIVNGNLGVGTNLPSGKLEVFWQDPTLKITQNPSSPGDAALQISAAGASNLAKIKLGGATLQHNTNSGNPGNLVMMPDGGYVGIGTTNPQWTLDVFGSAHNLYGVWSTSDIKFKKDILPIDSALDKILKLGGVSFEWIKDKTNKEDAPTDSTNADDNLNRKYEKDKIHPEDGRHYGVIAQEIEKVLPEVVREDKEGNKAVAYTEIIPVLIEAMKEQQKQITAQIVEIKDQQKRIEELEKKVAQLK